MLNFCVQGWKINFKYTLLKPPRKEGEGKVTQCRQADPKVAADKKAFIYRRPILWTLYVDVDFLKVLKIAVVWGGGVTGT